MDTTRVSETEFERAFSTFTDRARHEPVTKEGRDHVVVVSAEEYARLKRRDRRVGLTTELPDEWLDAVNEAKVPDEFAYLNAELD